MFSISSCLYFFPNVYYVLKCYYFFRVLDTDVFVIAVNKVFAYLFEFYFILKVKEERKLILSGLKLP